MFDTDNLYWQDIIGGPRRMLALYLNLQEERHPFSIHDFDLLGWIERMDDGSWSCYQMISNTQFCGNEPTKDYAMDRVFDQIKIEVARKDNFLKG